jgi:hypothetical protein
MISIHKILSSKIATWFCILIAVFSRIVNVLFVSYTGRDKMFLVLQSKSMLSGHGLSIPQYFTYNVETPVYDFTPLWPPGYPILLAPFLKLFNYDIYWATTTLDIIVCLAFIFIVRRICVQLGMPTAAVNIMTLITGCFEYTFINESLPTDTVSLVFFLAGLSVSITALLKPFSFKKIFIASLLLFVPCLFRYNYPAISLVVVALIVVYGFIKKDRLLKKKGFVLFSLTTGFTILFFVIMKITTGHAGYAAPTERGFFPENIVHWFPAVPSSFINLAFLTSQGIRYTGVSFENSMLVLEVINVISILFLAIILFRLFFKSSFIRSPSPFNWFLVLGFAACVVLFGVLGYLSLTYAVQKGFLHDWNYVYEPRYFAFANIFLQISFIFWLFSDLRNSKKYFSSTLMWGISILLFIEVSHNIYFNTKVALNFKKYKTAVYREKDYSFFFSFIDSLEKQFPGKEIWAAAPGDNFYYYFATYRGHKGISDATNLKNNFPAAKRKTIFVFVLYDNEIAAYRDVLTTSNALLSGKAGFTNFYVAELKP